MGRKNNALPREERKNKMLVKHVINFSGHPLSQTVVDDLIRQECEIETLPVGVDLNESL